MVRLPLRLNFPQVTPTAREEWQAACFRIANDCVGLVCFGVFRLYKKMKPFVPLGACLLGV